MPVVPSSTVDAVLAAVEREGFAFVRGAAMRDIFQQYGTLADWGEVVASWNDLALDSYMADGGRYRRRRHAVFTADTGGVVVREPHQPHYQSLDYNPLHGGVERWFQPIEPWIGAGPSLQTIIAACHDLFARLSPATTTWRVEVHQFRIEASAGESGRPTPEGLHRDGVDYVLVLLISRQNIASGVTGIHALNGTPLGSFTLTEPLDAAFVDDRRVTHGVTPVEPMDPHQPAYRDVLVVTFRRRPAGDPETS